METLRTSSNELSPAVFRKAAGRTVRPAVGLYGIGASMSVRVILLSFIFLAALASPLFAEDEEGTEDNGSIITFWPFFDYRESPGTGFSNLSILGPLFKLQHRGGTTDLALRPLFYHSGNSDSEETDYLYPIASSSSWAEGGYFQILKLFQKPKPAPGSEERRGTMLFPFYITGRSDKYGPYVSVLPFYGDIYERLWRDEIHYVMFPFYSRTVKKGTETTNYLYPFFSLTRGERESGFQFWPLYGQAEKEGVYRRRFALWPVFLSEESGLDTDEPTRKFYLFPFYTSAESEKRVERRFLWPFFGYVSDSGRKVEERDYFWPFFSTVRSESRHLNRFLPF